MSSQNWLMRPLSTLLTRQSWLGAGRDRAAADEFGALSGEAVEGGVSGGVGSAGDDIGEQLHPSPLAGALFTVAVTQALAWSPGQGQLLDLVLSVSNLGSQRAPLLPAIAAGRRSAFIMMSRGWNSLPAPHD